MIRSNGFCLALTDDLAREAATNASRIDRMNKGIAVLELPGGGATVALALEPGESLPVVHGLPASETSAGEFSALSRVEGLFEGSRDSAGTRPLFLGDSGDWLASDHRFLPGRKSTLLPAGSRYLVGRGDVNDPGEARPRFGGTFEEASERLAELLAASVESRTRGKRKVAVAFSGGLDSSLVAHCAKKHSDVIACSVNAPGSIDQAKSSRVAETLGIEFRGKTISREDARRELESIDLPFEPTPMDRSLWCIYSVASRMAREEGAELILLGQLADELFGGYAKYQATLRDTGPAEVAAIMEHDVADCGVRGLVRDELACARWTEPRFPFADESVLHFGRSLPVEFRLRDGVRKAVLRAAAYALGLPEEVADAPKKAAQYSSGVSKLIS